MWADPFEDTVDDACKLVSGLTEFNVQEAGEYFAVPTLGQYEAMVIDVIQASFAALHRIEREPFDMPTDVADRQRVDELCTSAEFRNPIKAAWYALASDLEQA